MIGRVPKNGLGVVGACTYHDQRKTGQRSSTANSLTESDLLGLGDDVDAGVGACALGEAVTCNSKGLEHANNR